MGCIHFHRSHTFLFVEVCFCFSQKQINLNKKEIKLLIGVTYTMYIEHVDAGIKD